MIKHALFQTPWSRALLLIISSAICAQANAGQSLQSEVEPNDTAAQATPIASNPAVIDAPIFPNGDIDFYSFSGTAGDRIYAATMTSLSANSSPDSVLDLLDSDGATVLETDDNDGTFGSTSSSIAGFALPANGTYFLRVKHFAINNQLRPYRLYFSQRSGAPTVEVEPNDSMPGQALAASGWVSGDTSSITDSDFYSISLNAGDTVWLSLDLDPERDTNEWNGQVGFGTFGTPATFVVANDVGAGTPDSESFFMTVKAAGTYGILVGLPGGGTTFGTYHLNAVVFPSVDQGQNCTTYTSTDIPVTIPTGPGVVTSTLTVPGNPRISDVDVELQLNHTFMQDLDIALKAPGADGNTVGLLSDIGAATLGGSQTTMDLLLDDEAAIPPSFPITQGFSLTPELNYRLAWLDGQDAGGTWTLTIRDDATGDGGTLNGWSLRICEPPPPPACPSGTVRQTVYSSDFEANDGGFTHSGTSDEWERGTPTFAPIQSCNSGSSCWKTDLDNTYNTSASQDLLSPNIDLSGFSPPVLVSWAQKYQMESASFDHYSVDIQPVGNPAAKVRMFEWMDATMTTPMGNPTVTVQEAAGWGRFEHQADALAGQNTELLFHVDSDGSIQLTGVAIDDVSVSACRIMSADLSITKTDGITTAVPGTSTVYTITASNAGPDAVTGATLSDTFPAACVAPTWTCVGAAGGTCSPGAAGNINDAVDLPVGASVTYTATCPISPAATGSLSNTATISSAVGDPSAANNSATDIDTLTPQADLLVTKTDGLATAVVGQAFSYTIVVGNIGPSNAPGSTVMDSFPAAASVSSWTCVGAGGATCTAGPVAGNINDNANIPVGGQVTYTATGVFVGTGTVSNTATATVSAGVTELAPGNNSATDLTNVSTAPLVSASKTVSGNNTPGSTITYTLVLTNSGGSTQPDNPGDELVDTLPAGLTLVSANASSGTVSNVGNTLSWNGSIPAAGSVTIQIDASIDAGTEGQTLSNQATVNFDGDGNGSNESSAPSDDPSVGGSNDATLLAVASAIGDRPVPVMSPLLLILLSGALIALGAIRRRPSA